jgi:hypothetical protein
MKNRRCTFGEKEPYQKGEKNVTDADIMAGCLSDQSVGWGKD